MNSKFKAIAKRIKNYDTIVIARHIGPDPDAIASQIALRDSIKLRYPSKKVYAVGTSVAKFKHFGELDKINDSEIKNALLFVLDCPNIVRIDGTDIGLYDEVIKIDHHPFIDRMGIIEWVDTRYTSACEMITEFLIASRFRSNKKIAENLFLGVVSDSDRFLFDTVSPRTFELMSILIKNSKIKISELYPRLYLRPLNEVRFQSYITEHLNVTKNGFASLKIDKKILQKYGVDSGTPSNLVNNFNNIKEVLCWALVSYDEKQKLYKINIRSRGPVINGVAAMFNGGGHKYASGAKIENALDVDKLLRKLDVACANYCKANDIGEIKLISTPVKEETSNKEETPKEEIKDEKKNEIEEKEKIEESNVNESADDKKETIFFEPNKPISKVEPEEKEDTSTKEGDNQNKKMLSHKTKKHKQDKKTKKKNKGKKQKRK